MRSLTETRKRASGRGRRRVPIAGRDIDVVSIATLVLTVFLVVLTALTVHNTLVTVGVTILAIVICCFLLAWYVRRVIDADRRIQKKMARLARKIEVGPGGVAVMLLRGKGSRQSFKKLKDILKKENERLSVVRLSGSDVPEAKELLNDLAKLLMEDERLSVVRLDGRHILEAPPGIPENAIPQSIECLKIVGLIGWELEQAPRLNEQEKEVAEELRGVVTFCLQQSNPLDKLRQYAVDRVKWYEGLTDRLVLLASARPEALQRPAGKWLLDLLDELGCTFGVLTQEDQPRCPVGQIVGRAEGRRYAGDTLSPWLSEQKVGSFFPSLRNAVLDPQGIGLDRGLLQIRCAVLAAAAELGKRTEADAIEHLPPAGSPVPGDLVKAAALEVRWLVDTKAARTGVLDRLAVVDKVTPEMFAVLLRDLEPDAGEARKLFDWLRGDEFDVAGITVSTDDAISLGDTVRSAIQKWLGEDDQSAMRQQVQIAAERCYRECLILDPSHVPGSGYTEWMKKGYAGLTLFENLDWQENVYAWCHHAAEIESTEERRDARVAITCLFLEAWWWWGDQLRPPLVVKLLDLARGILQDQPGWINALDEFNDNYVPQFDQRAGAADKWRHVASALAFLARSLDLRQGTVPADRVLARIYVCWCSFNGDAAQHTGDLEAADRWFSQSAEACDDGENGTAMRAFANYQRADAWIPSDTDRSMQVITETSLADAANNLDDLELRAYLARMYGDIRWKSGNDDGAFDAYGRALLLSYVYQVDQESPKMPPTDYTYWLYNEMRTRLLARLDEVREKGLESAAHAASARIRKLFGPYWASERTVIAAGDDRLTGIAPRLPGQEDLEFGSGYVSDAVSMKYKLREQVAEPVDQPLPQP
jgi:hypothetical protein